jgi:hypothetical protein
VSEPDSFSEAPFQRHHPGSLLAANLMADSAEQLQRLYVAGFELQTFERYPKCIGVVRENCVALLVPGVDGLQILGSVGWRMGEVMGVLTEKDGRKVFQSKNEIVEATAERMEMLRLFQKEISQVMRGGDNAKLSSDVE